MATYIVEEHVIHTRLYLVEAPDPETAKDRYQYEGSEDLGEVHELSVDVDYIGPFGTSDEARTHVKETFGHLLQD